MYPLLTDFSKYLLSEIGASEIDDEIINDIVKCYLEENMGVKKE